MVLKKDKQKVLGEVFDDERVRSFLDGAGYGGISADYRVLERAYRGMNIENFARFVEFFLEHKRDINAQGAQGKTLLQEISGHRQAEPYVEVLKAVGATW